MPGCKWRVHVCQWTGEAVLTPNPCALVPLDRIWEPWRMNPWDVAGYIYRTKIYRPWIQPFIIRYIPVPWIDPMGENVGKTINFVNFVAFILIDQMDPWTKTSTYVGKDHIYVYMLLEWSKLKQCTHMIGTYWSMVWWRGMNYLEVFWLCIDAFQTIAIGEEACPTYFGRWSCAF